MDFWGVDRSRVSIRARALDRLCRIDAVQPGGDLEHLSQVLAAPGKANGANAPMYPKEFEVLLALVDAAGYVKDPKVASILVQQFSSYFVRSLEQQLIPSPTVRALVTSPWFAETAKLAKALLSLNAPVTVFEEYMRRASDLWARELEPAQLLTWAFSIYGFLEGAATSDHLTVGVGRAIYDWIKVFFTRDFLALLHNRLSAVEQLVQSSADDPVPLPFTFFARVYEDPVFNPGPAQLVLAVSQFIGSFARAIIGVQGNGLQALLDSASASMDARKARSLSSETEEVPEPPHTDLLRGLAVFSATSVETLESGIRFRASVSPQLIPLDFHSIWNYFEVIGIAVYYRLFDSQTAFSFFLEAAESDQVDSKDDSVYNVIRLAMICCRDEDPRLASVIKVLPGYLGALHPQTAEKVGSIFVTGIAGKPQTWLVSALYALANSLSVDEYLVRKAQFEKSLPAGGATTESMRKVEQSFSKFAASILAAVVSMALKYDDDQVDTLAITILCQKYGSVNLFVDREILMAYAKLAPHLTEREFDGIVQEILRADRDAREKGKEPVTAGVQTARTLIASSLPRGAPIYYHYLAHLLTLIVEQGDIREIKQSRSQSELSAAAEQVTCLLSPLATLLPDLHEPPLEVQGWGLTSKFRDAWLNLVLLGFNRNTSWSAAQIRDLEIIARSTPPLVSEESANRVESELELNAVLLRGSSHANVGNQKRIVASVFGAHNHHQMSRIPFAKLMFLSATVLVEYFRVRAGVVSKIALYFGDPDLRTGEGYTEMEQVSYDCINEYISCVLSRSSDDTRFDLDSVAEELKQILVLCCHRVAAVREMALNIANMLISRVPSSLCHRTSMFALLDLLTLMWESCVDAEEDEYESRTTFTSERSGFTIELSDSYDSRRYILRELLSHAKQWSQILLPLMSEDVKSLLTFYLDDLENSTATIFESVAIGRSFALEMGGTMRDVENILGSGAPHGISSPHKLADGVSGFLSQYLSLAQYRSQGKVSTTENERAQIRQQYDRLCNSKNPKAADISPKMVRDLYVRTSPYIGGTTPLSLYLVRCAVHVPFRYFTGENMKTAIAFWLWAINQNPELRLPILQAVVDYWNRSVYRKIGLFSRKLDMEDPLFAPMEYAPTNKKLIDHDAADVEKLYEPHVALIDFLKSSFHSTLLVAGNYLDLFARLLRITMFGITEYASLHPLAQTARLELVKLCFEFLVQYTRHRPKEASLLREQGLRAILSWYKQMPQWPFGGNRILQRKNISLLTSISDRVKASGANSEAASLVLFLMQSELSRLQVWADPLGLTKAGNTKFVVTPSLAAMAWNVEPACAVYMCLMHAETSAQALLSDLIGKDPLKVVEYPQALHFFLQSSKSMSRRYCLYWAQTSPIESIDLFASASRGDMFLLQYAMRSLESHPITTAFFYVPQIVQSLRHDSGGYVEEYILEAAKFSQLFAHQIIWNIKANSYRDDESKEPDPMKPTLDRVIARMKSDFSEKDREFYDTEFGFFNEVTNISGKLKPYIKSPKSEKKAKIDEEMARIVVPKGVYLPSNPDGTVVDIDRESGKPLQSHAKAPFLASFIIRKDIDTLVGTHEKKKETIDVRQSAIFKVGDDCRQDVLALQIISVFRSIFNYSGLDCFLYPYKVTATGPGCGVIDVLTHSTSRDMLGREAVNGLKEWFLSKHGAEDSIAFQRARTNFVKSMASYSVISYLLQFKDRHNGNIMYDDDGHVIHIDFGFCFDIVPGGVKFEAAPFKLTKEMVAVMGGSPRTQAYRWFEELCVKAFLCCRVYAEDIIRMVVPMLESGLPCFRPDTIKKLRGRFVLHKSDYEAAQYMRGLIAKSYESSFTVIYDEFQRLTNGIPY